MQDALLNAIARSNDIEVKEEKEKKPVKVKSAKKAIVRKPTSYTYEESNWRCGGSSSYSSQTNWRC